MGNRISWRAYKTPRAFYWEQPSDSDTAIVAVADEHGLTVTVSDEQAVDSYNAYFDCSITMPEAQAIKLRDLLNAWYPNTKPPKGQSEG